MHPAKQERHGAMTMRCTRNGRKKIEAGARCATPYSPWANRQYHNCLEMERTTVLPLGVLC